jgi:3-deoxy-D-manno-octulosonic-acid transferase
LSGSEFEAAGSEQAVAGSEFETAGSERAAAGRIGATRPAPCAKFTELIERQGPRLAPLNQLNQLFNYSTDQPKCLIFAPMSRLLYNIFVIAYTGAIRLAALWNPKARLWVRGRRNRQGWPAGNQGPSIWMHCASLGEFEQGLPVLESIKKQFPAYKVVVSFFSPSGYEVKKGYTGADHICYLPVDSPGNAARFVEAVNPALVIWVKYDYWFHHLTVLKRRQVPVLLVSATFRPGQPFFAGYGAVWRQMLQCFTALFVQNETAAALLQPLRLPGDVLVSGDTRFDRVTAIAEKFEPVPGIDAFCSGAKVVVAGSTWEEDEDELVHYTNARPEIRFIIAPHEIGTANLHDVKKRFKGAIFYSELLKGQAPGHILLIDNVGMLSRLYRYAHIAYVGGGFGSDGVHNVLEAAVYGKPVVMGPEYGKYAEAVDLVNCGGAISIHNALALEKTLDTLLGDAAALEKAAAAAHNYVHTHGGATQKVLGYVQEKRLLTS